MAAPPGAVILSAPPPVRNEFGEFVMLKYYLPIKKKEEKKGSRPPRRRKKGIARASLFGLETRGNKSTGREKVHGKLQREASVVN